MKDKSPAARQYVNINHVGNTLLINHFVGKKLEKKNVCWFRSRRLHFWGWFYACTWFCSFVFLLDYACFFYHLFKPEFLFALYETINILSTRKQIHVPIPQGRKNTWGEQITYRTITSKVTNDDKISENDEHKRPGQTTHPQTIYLDTYLKTPY